jgi:hypothetical protein
MLAIGKTFIFTGYMSDSGAEFDLSFFENTEIKFSTTLRDGILSFMPPNTVNAKFPVKVEYIPDTDEDTEITLEYDPDSGTLSIEVEEAVFTGFEQEDGDEPVVIFDRGCSLHCVNGKVIEYSEFMGELNMPKMTDEMYLKTHEEEAIQHAEHEMTGKLTQDKVEYLLEMLRKI